jgi:hypothetical protein
VGAFESFSDLGVWREEREKREKREKREERGGGARRRKEGRKKEK